MRRCASRFLAFGLIAPALIGLSTPSAAAAGPAEAGVIAKSFAPDTVALDGISIATITVTNPNAAVPIANVQFSDTMPAGIDLIAQTGGTCGTPATGGGTFSINPGADTFSSTSTVLAGGQACTITVQVKGTIVGAHVNTTSQVTADNVPPGAAATATLTVTDEAPPAPVTDPPNAPSATCAGLPATQVGSAASEVIFGTPGNDVIHALGGDDVVRGLGGDDVICGDGGNDRLKGGRGDDRLYGQSGDDVLKGGRGEDVCRGGAGTDELKRCERP